MYMTSRHVIRMESIEVAPPKSPASQGAPRVRSKDSKEVAESRFISSCSFDDLS
jgi:hypothetical protein